MPPLPHARLHEVALNWVQLQLVLYEKWHTSGSMRGMFSGTYSEKYNWLYKSITWMLKHFSIWSKCSKMQEKLCATEQTAPCRRSTRRRRRRRRRRKKFYVETMSVRLPIWLPVSWYRQLNRLSDFHEIRYMNSFKKVLGCEFSENRRNDSRIWRNGLNEFLPAISTFLDRFGCNWTQKIAT
jgi:hypothetical protein